jgi:hypothetical protein
MTVPVRIKLPDATQEDLQQLARDPVKLPAVSPATPNLSKLAEIVNALKTAFETREGQNTSFVEKNVTWRELIGTGVVNITVDGTTHEGTPQPPTGGGGTPGGGTGPGPGFPPWPGYPPVGPPVETPIYGAPPAPTGVQAAGAFESVIVSWDIATVSYISHAEVWRNTADVIGSAAMVGTTTASIYSDTDVVAGTDYWYWVRFINKWDDTPSAYNATAGTKATTGLNIPELLNQLTGQITQTQLDATLSAEIDQIDTLATEISALTAGVSGAFDPAETYYFDTTAEGWVADTAATVSQSNGHLVVNSTGTTPSIKHTTDFDPVVPGNKYPVVKARIKRVSGSTWSGTLQWKTGGHGFSASYQSVLADPTIAVGDYATVEWDMSAVSDYTGNNILNLRLELGAASDDDFDIDWLAIGRNAPGASVAMVDQETTERTAADAAEASSREILAALVTGVADPTGSEDLADLTAGLIYQEKIARASDNQARVDDITTLQTTVGTHTSTLSVHGSSINGLEAQYTVKIDNAGHISGYGLASTAVGATPRSEFGVRADQFYVAPPATASASPPNTNLYDGYVWLDTSSGNPATYVRKYYDADSSTWSTTPQSLPFMVITTPQVINGHTVSPGVYMRSAYIHDGQITNAKIANLAVDNAKIASLDVAKLIGGYIEADRLDSSIITAKVASLTVAKITTGIVGGDFYSDNYASSGGTAGWAITKAGTLVAQNATIRGQVYADSGYFAGSLHSPSGYLGQCDINNSYVNSGAWAYVRTNGHWWDSTNGFVAAQLVSDGSSFMHVKAGSNFIVLGAGPNSGGAGTAVINFGPSSQFYADQTGYVQATNIYARGNIEATSIKADAANIVNTIHLAGNAVTVPTGTSAGQIRGPGVIGAELEVMVLALDSGGFPIITSWFMDVSHNWYTEYMSALFKLYRNGSLIRTISIEPPLPGVAGGVSIHNPYSFAHWDVAPGSGTVTYSLRVVTMPDPFIGYDSESGIWNGTAFALGCKR